MLNFIHFFAGKCFHMSSFGESSAGKFSGSQASKYVQYNRRQLSRTYPAGTRVTSTNYDPLPMWNAGCQIGRWSGSVKVYISVCVIGSNCPGISGTVPDF